MSQELRKVQIRHALQEAREKTLWLLGFVSDDFLKVRVHDFYSPVGWHFGHVGMTEEYWAVTRAAHGTPRDERLSFLFANVPENPKDNRVFLPDRVEIAGYLAETRSAALSALDTADLDASDPLLADGYAWEFAYQHERQHQETIVELLQLIHQQNGRGVEESIALPAAPSEGSPPAGEMVCVPGGEFIMGADDPHGYDNEKRAHPITVGRFELDRTPVTAGDWKWFIQDGGYARRSLWSEPGWAWRASEAANRPEYWLSPRGASYFGPLGSRPIHEEEPVSSISWFEADAYARWAGKRLPTEAEWEYAARYDPEANGSRQFPWGSAEPDPHRACFGLNGWSPDPAGIRPLGASAVGALDMAGGVWEWTATPFLPYPGFEAHPYDGYSKDHMDGTHYVCRGGSWATSGRILRSSFRNWYVPTYRQGFLGLRCAR